MHPHMGNLHWLPDGQQKSFIRQTGAGNNCLSPFNHQDLSPNLWTEDWHMSKATHLQIWGTVYPTHCCTSGPRSCAASLSGLPPHTSLSHLSATVILPSVSILREASLAHLLPSHLHSPGLTSLLSRQWTSDILVAWHLNILFEGLKSGKLP